MRPRTLAEFAGQQHMLGEGALLRRMIDADRLSSLLFWGPPGTGKTTLAEVIALHTGRHFERANAAMVGVKEIRHILDGARRRVETDQRRTILFLDEIHRFARNQQDVLLGDVEQGLITLIGATTENPQFTINNALVSRSVAFRFEPLGEDDIKRLLMRALQDERGYQSVNIALTYEAAHLFAVRCDGDARRALTALEIAIESTPPVDGEVVIDEAVASASMQAKLARYDRDGDDHYDVISAFIKSMRAGHADKAIMWLARMLDAGEDPRFIARRIAIFASEDVGHADPSALSVASSAWLVTERVGMPECRIVLAQAALHMANAPKSRAAIDAIDGAMTHLASERTNDVPEHQRSSAKPHVQRGQMSRVDE